MNTTKILIPALVALLSVGYAVASEPPDETPEGLVRVKKAKASLVYVRPGVDFSVYKKVVMVEPQIAFRHDWKSDYNSGHMGAQRITDTDMANMIATGKKLLVEAFASELQKGGYVLGDGPGAGVLAIRANIVELDVYAPDPRNMSSNWAKTYSDGSAEATLVLELYDSATAQLLARAYDQRSNSNNGYTWRVPRTHQTNVTDARLAFEEWAQMLVKGLERTKEANAKTP